MVIGHTMRELWEDVRNRHASIEAMGKEGPYLFCQCCDESWPCIDHWNATAALKMLDESRRLATIEGHRALLDPPVSS